MQVKKRRSKILLIFVALIILAVILLYIFIPNLPGRVYIDYYTSKASTAVKHAPPVRWLRAQFSGDTAAELILWDGSGEPAPGSYKVSEIDGMLSIYIPAGEFLMGSSDEQALALERPQRTFYLDDYWIDQTEVTNAMYRLCVQTGVCDIPAAINPEYNDTTYADHPVIFVTWDEADTYCRWVGGKLPSEAQWDKAARGTDGRLYPWGEQNPDQYLLNFNNNLGGTCPVGSYPEGASSYGVLDMAGNVREWIDDWFSETYFLDADDANPHGPAEGEYKVLKGGGYSDGRDIVRCTTRCLHDPVSPGANRGFRCVR